MLTQDMILGKHDSLGNPSLKTSDHVCHVYFIDIWWFMALVDFCYTLMNQIVNEN